jgi:hypothetical protein
MSKHKFATAVGLAVSLAAASAAAQAPESTATLKGIEGKGRVMVNQGEEFVAATEGMRLKPGDRVMVQDDSSADIQFDDECQYEIDENRIVTIPDKSTCAGGVPLVQELNPTGGAAIGSTAAGATRAPGALDWVFTAAVVGTEICWLLCEDDDDTVSP